METNVRESVELMYESAKDMLRRVTLHLHKALVKVKRTVNGFAFRGFIG